MEATVAMTLFLISPRHLEDIHARRVAQQHGLPRLVGHQLGGSLTMFQTRDYGYQAELQDLSPPWFPVIGDAYTVLLFRELPAST
jgi:hypothetical protein